MLHKVPFSLLLLASFAIITPPNSAITRAIISKDVFVKILLIFKNNTIDLIVFNCFLSLYFCILIYTILFEHLYMVSLSIACLGGNLLGNRKIYVMDYKIKRYYSGDRGARGARGVFFRGAKIISEKPLILCSLHKYSNLYYTF